MVTGQRIYHGVRGGDTGCGALVLIETEAGDILGVLRHVVRHSPGGFNWATPAAGPRIWRGRWSSTPSAEDARCPRCAGSGRTVYDDTEPDGRPARDGDDPELVAGRDRGDGYRTDLPYQDFKFAHVSGWGDDWRITQTRDPGLVCRSR